MFFGTCEHYDDNQPFLKIIKDECFICYEFITFNKFTPISLKHKLFYVKTCGCDGSVHESCLKLWLDKNNNCPICRNKLKEKTNIDTIIYTYLPYNIIFTFYYNKITFKIIRFFVIFFFLYSIIDFYSVVLINKFNQPNYTDFDFYDIDIFISNSTTLL